MSNCGSPSRGSSKQAPWIDSWVKDAVAGKRVPGQRELCARFTQHPVAPLQVLIAVASVFLFSRWNEKKLPSDQRLTWALARAVFAFARSEKQLVYHAESRAMKPYYRKPTKTDLKDTGERIRNILGSSVLLNTALAIEQELESKQRAVAALHKPFTTT